MRQRCRAGMSLGDGYSRRASLGHSELAQDVGRRVTHGRGDLEQELARGEIELHAGLAEAEPERQALAVGREIGVAQAAVDVLRTQAAHQFAGQRLLGAVARAHQRPGHAFAEAAREARLAVLLEAAREPVLETAVPQRIADRVATFGGSWTFIISFGVFLFLWICANVILLANKGWDPYPFILLNLILSCIAALQAPVIMMSQNRQEEKDRERSRKDYMINLKSELEIRILHEKIDHLMMHQQQELLEIQRVQIDMMKDIMNRVNK